jgi:hypothetical protein
MEYSLMTSFWWIVPVAVVALGMVAILAWPRWRRYRTSIRFQQARRRFHLRREWLEADFLTLAAAAGKARGLAWRDCEFEDEAVFATDRNTGQLRAFAGVAISFEAVDDGGMEDSSNVGNLRAATAVFLFDGNDWMTEGRALFNLNPFEAIERFQHEVELVD